MADPVVLLQDLADCWCTALAASIGGAPATCCMVSSDPVIPDCCDGFGWVRMTGFVPVYAGGKPDRCNHPTWKMHVELGISRCAPPLCGNGTQNPCCPNEASAVNIQMGDFAAFTRALGCCLVARNPDPYADSISPEQVVIGSFVVDDPLGQCVTTRGTATIQFSMRCDCGN